MHACLLDVLHDAANQHPLAVADRVHVHFDRVVQEAVQQHRRVVGDRDGGLEVALEVDLVVDDLHCAAAQHIRRTHHQRIAEAGRFLDRLLQRSDGGVSRLLQVQAIDRLLEALAVFGAVNRVRAGADNRHARRFQRARQLQRRLAAVLHDHAFRLLNAHDLQHVFQRDRLEVETVRGVVVGRDRFRVTVHHDGFETIFAQRQRRVHAAVVELDALPDAVWSAAQHHNLVAILIRVRLALLFIGGVHIGGIGRELGGAGIDALIDRMQVVLLTQLADLAFRDARQRRQTRVGKAFALQHAQERLAQTVDAFARHLLFQTHQFFNLHQEPAVNIGQVKDAIDRHPGAEGIGDIPDTLGAGIFQLAANAGQRIGVVKVHFRVEAVGAHFQAAQRFLHRLLEGAANRHHFADRFHLGGQTVVRAGEFLEVKARDLGDDIVDRGFERRRSQTAGDVVHQLVQREADCQLGRHFGDREAGRLRGERRGARDARVHFDHDQTAVLRVNRELDVGAAGFHADFTQHRQRGVTHDLILFIGQRLRRRDGDGVAGVNAHGVEVFDRADDDAVVVLVAHHLHLILFPANQRLIDQQLVGGREIEAAFADLFKLFTVVGDAAAGAAHGERGTNNAREADIFSHGQRFFHGMGDA